MIVKNDRHPRGDDLGPLPVTRSNRVSGGRIEPMRPTPARIHQAAYKARLREKRLSEEGADGAV